MKDHRVPCEACAGAPDVPICAVCGGSGYVEISDTPRTDALFRKRMVEAATWELCRDLERQVAELRAAHDKLAVDYEKLQYAYAELHDEMNPCHASGRCFPQNP